MEPIGNMGKSKGVDKKAEILPILERVKSSFHNEKTRPLAYRLQQLRALCSFITNEEGPLLQALKDDFKAHYEALGELRTLRNEIIKAIDDLSTWMRPEKVSAPFAFFLDSCTIQSEPRGVTLIIAPWNYPLDLLLEPLVGAIAAGCTAILKPSEVAVNTARVLAEILPRYLDSDCFAVVSGGVDETTILLEWTHWNLIFYTGNGRVGRLVQAAAATHLIPTILELGGKSPCIVSKSTDLLVTAKRIAFGKWLNAGQTCVAPDYILTFPEMVEPLAGAIVTALKSFYGDDPCQSPDYSKIVNHRHWDRLNGLLAQKGEHIVVGTSDRENCSFAPTLVVNPSVESELMKEEIFGPILPIVTIDSIRQAISFVNARDAPLALYLFTTDAIEVEAVVNSTTAGGVCINDTLMQVITGILPFGGVGASGMGRYKGRWSFEAFSHPKPVMWRSQRAECLNDWTRNPPIDESKFSKLSMALFSQPKASRHL